MSVAVRVIPCLDIKEGRIVKGLRFENLRDAGDPVEAAVRYEREGADELTFLDITASHEQRGTLLHLVERVASVLSIPFTVGGGVRSVEDAGALLSAGADRVTVNTIAVQDPSLITRIAEKYGSQCVVVAVDGKRVAGEDGAQRLRVVSHGGRKLTARELEPWVAEATAAGAGEILLTSMDADGTKDGFDLEMLKVARRATTVPIVASGGAGHLGHFAPAVTEAGADAVLAASVFHDRIYTVGQVKRAMAAAGVSVRLEGAGPFLLARFDSRGLIPAVVRDAVTGQVLMLAWANAEALERTRETGYTHFYSRSRKSLWKKGETSGNLQRVVTIQLDCDNDAVLYDVVPEGPACHTGTMSCFREVMAFGDRPGGRAVRGIDLAPLFEVVAERKAHPEEGTYTTKLLSGGIARIAKKVGEEGVETALAATGEGDDELAGEIADLLYHLVVLMTARGLDPARVDEKLASRRGQRRAT